MIMATMAPLFVGYDLGAFRLEAEVAYKRADVDDIETVDRLPGRRRGSRPSDRAGHLRGRRRAHQRAQLHDQRHARLRRRRRHQRLRRRRRRHGPRRLQQRPRLREPGRRSSTIPTRASRGRSSPASVRRSPTISTSPSATASSTSTTSGPWTSAASSRNRGSGRTACSAASPSTSAAPPPPPAGRLAACRAAARRSASAAAAMPPAGRLPPPPPPRACRVRSSSSSIGTRTRSRRRRPRSSTMRPRLSQTAARPRSSSPVTPTVRVRPTTTSACRSVVPTTSARYLAGRGVPDGVDHDRSVRREPSAGRDRRRRPRAAEPARGNHLRPRLRLVRRAPAASAAGRQKNWEPAFGPAPFFVPAPHRPRAWPKSPVRAAAALITRPRFSQSGSQQCGSRSSGPAMSAWFPAPASRISATT